MYWIGITGAIGSGKSTVAQMLREMSYEVLDADQLAHFVLQKNQPAYLQVVEKFGQQILNEVSEIDRGKLAEIVFSEEEKLRKLEEITHAEIHKIVSGKKEELKKNGVTIAFYDVPLLFEKKLQDQFDFTMVVFCDYKTQEKRLMKRNSWTKKEIEQRLKFQMPMSQKKEMADFCIENMGNLEALKTQVLDFLERIKQEASTNPKSSQKLT